MSRIHIIEKYNYYGTTRYDVYYCSGLVYTYFDYYLPPKVTHFMGVAEAKELPLPDGKTMTVYTEPTMQNGSAMKKTQFTTMVSSGVTKSKWQRVYTDEDGNYYIKANSEWICINGTPSEDFMVKN